jgi:uncharacterized membrane protein
MADQNDAHSDKLPAKGQQEPAQKLTEDAVAERVLAVIRQEFLFSGPLPPPQILNQYNDAVANGAERIMAMAEKQSEHRRKLEATVLKTDSRNSLLGIVCAFVLGLVTVVTGAVVVVMGHTWPGTILGSAGLVGLVSAFIYGTRERRKEREAKSKEM